jgi:PAS domain S-box-containing protein
MELGAKLFDGCGEALDQLPVAFYVKDLNLRYLVINEAGARYLGRAGQEALGKDDAQIFGPEAALAREERERRVLDTGVTEQYEEVAGAGDDSRTYVTTKVAYRDGAGRIAALLGMSRDISKRRAAEECLRLLSGRLLQLQDEERRRIAHSLHESSAQTLAALAMNLHQIGRAELPEPARRPLEESIALTEQCTREIRTLSHLLHPPLLDEAGLLPALQWYVEGFSQRSTIAAELSAPPDLGRLPRETEIAVFRVVQESLTNIHRHSGSPTATIRLERTGGSLRLEIADRGRGLPHSVLDPSREITGTVESVGISSMRDRVLQVGGQFRIAPQESGTVVTAVFPIKGQP